MSNTNEQRVTSPGDIEVARTTSTPLIRTTWADGVIVMQGDSYPENSFEFFQPLIDWVSAFLKTDKRPLKLELELAYLNTSSVRALMDILDMLEEAHGQGRSVAVRWYYDGANDRVGMLAGEFKEDCTFPFEILAQGHGQPS